MQHEHGPVSELLKGIPKIVGIRLNEEPEYQVLETQGDIEVRCYEAMTLVQLTMPGHYESFTEAAFTVLSDYIFGVNQEQVILPMTAPVYLQKVKTANWETVPFIDADFEDSGDTEWMMSFVLPSGYDKLNAPIPTNPYLKIQDVPRTIVAAVTYSGNNSLDKIKEHTEKLSSWLNHNPDYQAISAPMVAQYDSPMTIPFFKKNEIQIAVT